ncbi:MAG: hypothetical protein CM1200mP20_11530 [Pseudomonadota bacterium]|nr:MAG: hypothetical protein CM1200mP20_11530 [Pseudomonadota bacterium]
MRRAELLMALILGVFSAYLMYKSAELPIGWIPEEGPGGGAFPFWLSAGMLVCCGWIVLRWLLRVSLPSRSDEPYLATGARGMILRVVLALTLMIGCSPCHWYVLFNSSVPAVLRTDDWPPRLAGISGSFTQYTGGGLLVLRDRTAYHTTERIYGTVVLSALRHFSVRNRGNY